MVPQSFSVYVFSVWLIGKEHAQNMKPQGTMGPTGRLPIGTGDYSPWPVALGHKDGAARWYMRGHPRVYNQRFGRRHDTNEVSCAASGF